MNSYWRETILPFSAYPLTDKVNSIVLEYALLDNDPDVFSKGIVLNFTFKISFPPAKTGGTSNVI